MDSRISFKLTILILPFLVSSMATAMSHGQFIEKCVSLVSPESTSLKLICAPKTASDKQKLSKLGLVSPLSVDLGDSSRTSVGSSGHSLMDLAYQVKSGIWGGKSLRISCYENIVGQVELQSKDIKVDIEDRIDFKISALVTCK